MITQRSAPTRALPFGAWPLIPATSLNAAITAASATDDATTLAVVRKMAATVLSASVTPDTATLDTSTLLAAAITAASATNDTATLNILRAAQAAITAGSVTPNDASLAVVRGMAAAILAQSATPDTVTLDVSTLLAAAIPAASATPDDVVLAVYTLTPNLGFYLLSYGDPGWLPLENTNSDTIDTHFATDHTATGEHAVVRLQEQGSTPSAPTTSIQGKLYVKADKLVFMFDDAGTTKYFYIDLTATAAQDFTYSTSAP